MTSETIQPLYLVDSNVILDILLDHDNPHAEWSLAVLSECADNGYLAINQIIYAEISYAFFDLEELENKLIDYQKISLPWEAAFIASKAYAAYRKNGGKRHTLMPDFYIGAHALYANLTLVTRDRGYANYFPNLQLIKPAKNIE